MWALGILCSLLLLGKVLGHDETLEYSLGEEELLNVTEGVNSFQIRITDHIADTDHLEIVTNYVGDESYYEISDFTLSYTDQPLTWSLSNVTRSNAHLLCATNASDALEMALVVKKVGPEVSVMLVIQIVNITLPIGSTFEEEATLGNSATYLVDPTDGNLSKHGGVVVHVKNTSPDTENVCVIVAFQGNKCPLQNEIDTAKNSDKWMTVLEKGTTTLRQDREPFSGAFYVSVVVLEEDSDCYLPGKLKNGIVSLRLMSGKYFFAFL